MVENELCEADQGLPDRNNFEPSFFGSNDYNIDNCDGGYDIFKCTGGKLFVIDKRLQ